MRAISLIACASLAGCALAPTIEPGTTTESEILSTYGQPTRRWSDAGGTTTLEYATQPAGWSCLMFTINSNGQVVNARDALSDANLARVEVGMTEAQVDHLLGQHSSVQYFALSGETAWDWNIPSYGPGIATHFDVYFKDGRVARTGRDIIYGGTGGGMVFHPPAHLPCPRCTP